VGVAVLLVALAVSTTPSPAITPYPASAFAAEQPSTALDLIKLLPGFVLDTGPQARGFGASAGNVLIDGARPASKDDGLEEILKRIPASSVVRIDVIRGGAPGIDMQGKTVLANVIRAGSSGATLSIAGSGTLMDNGVGTGSLRVEGSSKMGSMAFEGSLLVGKGFDDTVGHGPRTLASPTGATVLQAAETSRGAETDYKATAGVEGPALGGKLRVSASLFASSYDYSQADVLTRPIAVKADEADNSKQRTAEIGVRYERPLGPKARLEAFALQQFGESRYRADLFANSPDLFGASTPLGIETFRLSKETSESIVRSTITIQPTGGVSAQIGAEGDFNWLLDHTKYAFNGAPISLPAANVRVTEARGDAFATTTWSVLKTINLEAGLRLESSRITSTGDVGVGQTFVFAKPRFAATWSPDDADQVRLRVEREVGQLDFDDFAAGSASLANGAVRPGNPSLTPQQDWVYEAAYDHRFWRGAQITFTARHYELRDIIDRAPIYDPSGTYDAPGNIGSGFRDEAEIALTVPTDRLGVKNGTITALQTFRKTRVIDPTTGQPRPISGVSPYGGEIHFTQGLRRWKISWGFDVLNASVQTYYRFNEVDIDDLGTYEVLFAEYKPRADLIVRFEFHNLDGRSYRHVRELYDGPRGVAPSEGRDIRDLQGNRLFYLKVRKTFS
jgi:outer membrane receptor protein involved in Fe transport